jgi:hypothetical protein
VRHSISLHKWILSSAIAPFAILISVSCWPVDAHAGARRSTLSTIPSARSSRSLDSEDRDSGETWAPGASGARNLGTGSRGHSGSGTYNPERIHRFWSLYHGARGEPKSKPLEREK